MLEEREIYELLLVYKQRLDSLIDRWPSSQISREDAEFLRLIILSKIEDVCMDVKISYLLNGEVDSCTFDRLRDVCKPIR